jgi:hypothetical protein
MEPERLAADLGVLVWDAVGGTEHPEAQTMLDAARDYLDAVKDEKNKDLAPLLRAAKNLAHGVQEYYGPPSLFAGLAMIGRSRGPTPRNWEKLNAASKAFEQERLN